MPIVGGHGLTARRFLLRVPQNMQEGFRVQSRERFTYPLSEAILHIPVRLRSGRTGSFDIYVDDDQVRELERYRWRRQNGDFVFGTDPETQEQVTLSEVILRNPDGTLGPRLTTAQAIDAGMNYRRANLRMVLGLTLRAPTEFEVPVYRTRQRRRPSSSPLPPGNITQQLLALFPQAPSEPRSVAPSGGQEEPLYYVEVDPRDLRRVQQHRWRQSAINPEAAPYTTIQRKSVYLGAFILQTNARVTQRDPGHDFRRANLRTAAETTRERVVRAARLRSQLQVLPPAPTTGVAYVPTRRGGWTLIVDADMEELARRYPWVVRQDKKKLDVMRSVMRQTSRGLPRVDSISLSRAIAGLQNPDTGERLNSDVLFFDPEPDTERRIFDLRRSAMKRTSSRMLRANTSKRSNATSRYYGVGYVKETGKWGVRLTIPREGDTPGKKFRIRDPQTGATYFESEVEAARVYDREVIRHRLDVLRGYRLNFPRSDYENER